MAPQPQPKGAFGRARARALAAGTTAWGHASYWLNCEWLALPRWPSFALFWLIIVGLALALGFTAVPVKDAVTLGVEFGGGYQLL